ncbi:MAG: ATP-grasp fold amidoligase family protein [Oliverpabstia sp.]|nr:ATP-grasp fold amidoligase family protein [Oliverpabstia sp.]
MDYKKILKTPAARKMVLDFMRFIPDSVMLPVQYKIKLGRKLNLKNPKRFTEKLQWYKMNYRNPIMHQCVDKYLVRDFVKSKGLESILVPLVGHYNSVDEISWNELPNEFVMKTTHGGGGLNVLVCDDKSKFDNQSIKHKFQFKNKPVASNTLGREWAYYGLIPGIVVEELLVNEENPDAGVNDYKIFCYNGEPKYIVVDVDRYIGHKRNFYNTNWDNLNIGSDCPVADRDVCKPENLDEMLKIAARLSEDFPFVRVDLYNCSGKIYFGELTFYPWSGYVQYDPDEVDFMLGEGFELTKMGNN